MANWRLAGVVGGVVAMLAMTSAAQGQVRGQVAPPRRHRPRVYQPARPPRPEPSYRGPWTASRASFVVSAESLLGLGYARRVEHSTDILGQDHETVSSGLVLHLFKGSELNAPLASARLGFDGVIGPGVTLGAGIGFNQFNEHLTADAQSAELSIRTFIFTPRIGYLLAPSRYLGVWLRGGIGYINLRIEDDDSTSTLSATVVVLDPMLVITPLPHVGIFVGPSLNIGLGGGSSTVRGGNTFPDQDAEFSYYGVTSGIGLLF